jgi:hypothetical protein
MIRIFFGAFCDPIAVQLARQHVAVADKERLAQLQRDADAVTRPPSVRLVAASIHP